MSIAQHSKREIISLSVGQCGIQLGDRLWELFGLEHNIGLDGLPQENGQHSAVMYEPLQSGRHVPRYMMVDLEPSVVDAVRHGRLGGVFSPTSYVHGKEDAANNFARGYFTSGREILGQATERLRKLSEACESLQAINIYSSVGGGTGSGFTSLLTDEILQQYKKIPLFHQSVFPSKNISTAVVEPFNAILTLNQLIENSSITLVLDNEGVYRIARSRLGIPKPDYANLNRLIARVSSAMTISLRFAGELNVDVQEFQTNLVPFQRLHFMLGSYAPMINISKARHENFSESSLVREAVTNPVSWFAMCNPMFGELMAASFLARGENISLGAMHDEVQRLREGNQLKFVDWCPTGVKIGLNDSPPKQLPNDDLFAPDRCLAVIANTTAIKDVFERISSKFDIMYAKRAFVHWYVGEGMEEGEFGDARENVHLLEKDYVEVSSSEEIDSAEEDLDF